MTENDDGSATLSWKLPTSILTAHEGEGGEALITIADAERQAAGNFETNFQNNFALAS